MRGGAKTSLFLIELLAALLLFSFCAAISLQYFLASNRNTTAGRDLSHAVLVVSSAAELYKATFGDTDEIAKRLGGKSDGGALSVNYDSDWNVTDGEGAYKIVITSENQTGVITAYKTPGEEQIYTLQVKAVR
ncbi:MAG: hypothetical protein LBN43_01100 [Oscillospiraceae bacterium]|jgi:type II secretory pathway pseudopilin PulG|nr:hypothetical protein [Oscillospiraceae bacterium]